MHHFTRITSVPFRTHPTQLQFSLHLYVIKTWPPVLCASVRNIPSPTLPRSDWAAPESWAVDGTGPKDEDYSSDSDDGLATATGGMISGRADSIGAASITTHTNGIRFGRPPGSAGSGLTGAGTNGAGSWPSGGADISPAFNSALSSATRFGNSTTTLGTVTTVVDAGPLVSSGRPDRRLNSAGSVRSYGGMGMGFRGDGVGVPGLSGSGLAPGMGARGSEAGMNKDWPMNMSVSLGCVATNKRLTFFSLVQYSGL